MSLRAFVLSTVIFVGCVPAVAPTDDGTSSSMSSSKAAMMDDDDDNGDAMEPSSKPTASTRVIEITTDNWSFSPSSISVKKGEKVVLRVGGAAGIHGVAIAELGINVRSEPGKSVDVELPTDKAGTFTFFCNIPCGPGHKDMKGTLTIS